MQKQLQILYPMAERDITLSDELNACKLTLFSDWCSRETRKRKPKQSAAKGLRLSLLSPSQTMSELHRIIMNSARQCQIPKNHLHPEQLLFPQADRFQRHGCSGHKHKIPADAQQD